MKIRFYWLFALAVLGSSTYQMTVHGKPMDFTIGSEPQRCGDPGCGGWINAIGEITPTTPADFKKFLSQTPYPPLAVRFNSPGGNLIAGLELGEIIRKNKLNTEAILCASACAYAFLGGVQRSFVDKQSKIGVHRFYHSKAMQNPTLQQFSGVDLDNTQKLMAGLLLYAMKMDIDLRILSISAEAGPEDMRWLSEKEAQELKVTYNPNYWLPWKVEPSGHGLIAFSETVDKTRYMQLGCSSSARGPTFSLLDSGGDEAWLQQCINISDNHPILGTVVPKTAAFITRHGGAPVVNFRLGKARPTYSSSSLFNNTNFYPMACISQFDAYSGTTANLQQAGSLALRNCVNEPPK